MTKTVLETLETARKLITPEENWTQGAMARDAEGNDIPAGQDEAVCWCGSGAINESAPTARMWLKCCGLLDDVTGGLETFNDTHTHADVLAAFDEAIAAEKAKVTA